MVVLFYRSLESVSFAGGDSLAKISQVKTPTAQWREVTAAVGDVDFPPVAADRRTRAVIRQNAMRRGLLVDPV